jgi:hypothetical protein
LASPSTHLGGTTQWRQHQGPPSSTPASSTATASDQLTPESESDDDVVVHPGAGLLGHGHGDSPEVYELQDRRQRAERLFGSDDEDGDEENEEEEKGRSRRKLRGRAGSSSTAASFTLYTPDEERAVVRKLDRRLVLFVALLYMLSFLDRSSA